VVPTPGLQRWSATGQKDPVAQMGMDEMYFRKQMKLITLATWTVASLCGSGRIASKRTPRPNSSFFRKQSKMRVSTNSCTEPIILKFADRCSGASTFQMGPRYKKCVEA
jgi:hypothetical protein